MENNLSMDTGLVQEILVGFIRSEITRSGFSRAVVNLSGGLDSSVSCVLAARALGPENVLALCLPYKTSAQDSLDHAQVLINQLGVVSRTISDYRNGRPTHIPSTQACPRSARATSWRAPA